MDLHEQVLTYARYKVDNLDRYLAKPTHFIIAVERHDKSEWDLDADDRLPEDRFLWIKGRNTTRVEEVRNSYIKAYRQPLASLLLKHGDFFPTPTTCMSELNDRDDQYVVFSAADTVRSKLSRDDSTTAKVKLEPSKTFSPSRSKPQFTWMNKASPRPVLQPINKQVANTSGLETNYLKSEQNSLVDDWGPRSSWTAVDENGKFKTSEQVRSPKFAIEPKTEEATNLQPQKESFVHSGPNNLENPPPRYSPGENDIKGQCGDDNNVQPVRGQPLRELALIDEAERLESGVAVGVKLLSQLADQISCLPSCSHSKAWLDQVAKVRQEAVKSRTVVGVVGNTGAGKSSVINAILDEERLVPTNCMRACTAVVTELSYNYATSEAAKYIATVEFIKPEDWRRELTVLFKEVFDENGQLNSETRNPDSEAGIALAKIRAVYNKFTNDMLGRSSVEKLMKVPPIATILGTTRHIKEQSPQEFYRRLQHYVDSKEKGSEKRDKRGYRIVKKNRDLEYWPLIKVVKIFTKAEALSTGAVIVDLPGVHDSNAARAAVAEGYMKQCTGLWIVAPITRAVDDKAAKTLLGDTFKRQLKYDGIYSAVTFICSKTDDISKTEAIDSLHLGDEMTELENQLREIVHKRRALADEIREARGTKQDCTDVIEDIENALEVWEELQDKIEDGKEVYAPVSANDKKRKRSENSSDMRRGSKKRRQHGSDDDDSSTDSVESVSEDVPEDRTGPPLTLENIENRIAELKSQKKDARKERSSMVEKCREVDKEIQDLLARENQIVARQDQLCIAGRNEYSREAIRQDFAAGIKELDQENALEEDEDSFDPDNDIRDYQEVARSLPVYCVSSRAYQKLCGHLEKDSEVAGFTTKEETEIPALQAHCKKLTENGRQATCRRFLNSLNQLLASLALWGSDEGTSSKLTNQQSVAEKIIVNQRLKELKKSLEQTVRDILKDATDTLTEQLFDHFGSAGEAAASQANETADHWSAPRHEGGLHFMTYRATTRRSGVYAGASGLQDFNAQLAEPIYKQLATNWERAFQRRLPQIFHGLGKTGIDSLRKFHTVVEQRCRESGHGVARIGMLSHNLAAHQAILSDIATAMLNYVNEATREINRQFTPIIATAMEPAYDMCNNESGKGCFMRIKAHMDNHVSYIRAFAFQEACDKVKKSLSDLFQHVQTTMLERVDGVFFIMERDYMSVVGNIDAQGNMSLEGRAAKRALDDTIAEFDTGFQNVLDGDPEILRKDHVQMEIDAEHDAAFEMPDEDQALRDEISDQIDLEEDSEEDDEEMDEDQRNEEYYQMYLDATEEVSDRDSNNE